VRDSEPAVHRGYFDQLRPILAAALVDLDIDDREIALSLITRELDEVEPPRNEAQHRGVNRAITERDTYYAFQVDDIKLLKEASLLTASMTGLVLLSKAPVGVVGALVVLLYRYRRRRIRLSGEEGIVLLTLKRAPSGGLTVDDLACSLPLTTELDNKQLMAILGRLQDIEREDGTKAKLADQTEQRWRAVDV
jgi:hypothetical protein